jgi:hypothetical protein
MAKILALEIPDMFASESASANNPTGCEEENIFIRLFVC